MSSLAGEENYGVSMCDRLREGQDQNLGLRQFILLLTNDADALSAVLETTHKPPEIKPERGRPYRADRMKLFRAAYREITRLSTLSAHSTTDKPLTRNSEEVSLPAVAQELLQEFQNLPLGAKAAMALVVIEGWSIQETATIMDTSVDRVRENLLEARRKISPDLWRKDYLPK